MMIYRNKVTYILFLSFIISCSSKKVETIQPPAETKVQVPIAKSPEQIINQPNTVASLPTPETAKEVKIDPKPEASSKIDPIKEDIKLILKKNGKLITSKEENKKAEKQTEVKRTSIPSDKALGWLKNGNIRFTKQFLRNDGAAKKDIKRLAEGQYPHSIILSCSDSRVPPEIVFDQKLGEIFVVRTAGESLDNTSIASIEYAVEHLGSKLIVVMGHQSCGAVKAALDTKNGTDAGSPALNALVADIQPRLQGFSEQNRSEKLTDESWANAKGVTKDLLNRSKIVKEAVTHGEVKIITSLYHIDNGKVEWAE